MTDAGEDDESAGAHRQGEQRRGAILVDDSLPEQEYVEDCQVCCRPMVLRVSVDVDGDAVVTARAENE